MGVVFLVIVPTEKYEKVLKAGKISTIHDNYQSTDKNVIFCRNFKRRHRFGSKELQHSCIAKE
jgi:hypothetical protein